MSTPAQNATLPELVRTLADDARELVKAEVGLAKAELSKTLRVLLIVIAGATAAVVVAVLSLCAFVAAGVLALGGSEVAALSAAAGWGALLVVVAMIGSARVLSRSQFAQPPVPSAEQRLSTTQSEVTR